jgi:FAD binding domain/Berberine and berberine like
MSEEDRTSMNRRTFVKSSGAASLLALMPRARWAPSGIRRVRPSDPAWPSTESWRGLKDAVGGNLFPVDFPINACVRAADSADCKALAANLKNPYYIGDTPGLTQTLGWVDAWVTKPSVYAVAARNAEDIAATVRFARQNDLRLVVKGGGHSYQGTSNAADSLLMWTRHMHDVTMRDDFVPRGCRTAPQRAVTVGSGAVWEQAYDTVTTQSGGYVQGGGCTTVGVAGLIQSGGFGSFSKHFGTAAASLLEAEVVTADGRIRVVNAGTDPDLFWALKGGGGGTFGVVSKLTLRVHDLPEFGGGAEFAVKATSDEAYRRLVRRFAGFYRESLFNAHWGEQAHFSRDNRLEISMVHVGLDTEQSRRVWKPFLDWVARFPGDYTIESEPAIGSMPLRHWWDVAWSKEHHRDAFMADPRPGANPGNVWWHGDSGQAGWVIWGFESTWLPASLLGDDSQEQLANALFAASRHSQVELHFNKGLAGGPADAVEAARDTAMNPAVCGAFALAIIGDGEGSAYPGLRDHEPDTAKGRDAANRVHRAMNELRTVAPNGGAYVSESNFFEDGFQHAYWGGNHARLAEVKKKYDPDGLFFVHNGVGSEQWSADGFTRR